MPENKLEPNNLNATKVISPANNNRKLTLQEKYMKSEELKAQGMNKTQICKSLNMDIRVYDKLQRMNYIERNSIFTTKPVEKSLEKATLKMERVQEVRNLKQQNLSIRKIALITGLSRKTVTKYLDDQFSLIHASTGIKRSSILTPFMEAIDTYLEQGIMGTVIENKLRNKGYEGSSSTIRNYIANWKRNIKQTYEKCSVETISKERVEKLARKDVIKLLFYPLEKVNAITQNQFEILCSEIPLFHIIHSAVWSFRKLLLDKEVEALDNWISAAKMLSIKEINSFINGLERDIDAVKNAVRYEYSNGLV